MGRRQSASAAARLERRFQSWALRRTIQPATKMTLGWRTLYILPTWFGVTFALLLAVLLLAALNYGANMLFAMAFWLGAFFLLAMHRTHRNLLGLALFAQTPQETFCGETVQWPLVLQQQDTGRPRYGITLGWTRQPQVATHLLARTQRVLLPQSAQRRGLLPCPPVVVSSLHPFGLFRVWAYASLAQQAVVFPAPLACPLWPWDSALDDREGSMAAAVSGDELEGLRPYRQGDARGRIAWKRSAGREELVSKVTAGRRASGTVILSLDVLPAADLETRLSWLCAAVLACEERGMGYALVLGDVSVGAGIGPGHRRECLLALARFGS